MLSESRKRIDMIDRNIVALIEERLGIVEKIATIKTTHQLAVYDPAREEELLVKVRKHTKNKKNNQCVEDVFGTLLKVSKDRQQAIMDKNK